MCGHLRKRVPGSAIVLNRFTFKNKTHHYSSNLAKDGNSIHLLLLSFVHEACVRLEHASQTGGHVLGVTQQWCILEKDSLLIFLLVLEQDVVVLLESIGVGVCVSA